MSSGERTAKSPARFIPRRAHVEIIANMYMSRSFVVNGFLMRVNGAVKPRAWWSGD
jgi:hypothetical protein